MPFSTLATLTASIEDWAEGEDVSGVVNDLILLAEAKLNRDVVSTERSARTTYSDIAAGTQELALPSDLWEIEHLRIDAADQTPLEVLAHKAFWDRREAYESGVPRFYTLYGTSLFLAPIPDGVTDFALDYVASIPSLVTNPFGNWLSVSYPDVYLAACLAEAALYVQDDAAAQRWIALREKYVGDVGGVAMRAETRPGARVRAA